MPVLFAKLQFPASLGSEPGLLLPSIFGRVYPGPDNGTSDGSIVAECGYGLLGSDPVTDSGWTWLAAAFNGRFGDEREYMAAFAAPTAPGHYAYTFRFAVQSADGSMSPYTYACIDGSGPQAGFQFDRRQLGVLSVGVPPPPESPGVAEPETKAPSGPIEYVKLQFPTALTVAPGSPVPVIFGRVYGTGLTETVGPAPDVVAQLGYGPYGTDPATNSEWLWVDATFNTQTGNDDEYEATFIAPAATGRYSYTFRFAKRQRDGSSEFTYADLDGNGTHEGLAFSVEQLGTLTVQANVRPAGPSGANPPASPPRAGFRNLTLSRVARTSGPGGS